MEFVTIKFVESRTVFIDGRVAGLTNVVLRTNEGTHSFDLGASGDYQPRSRKVMVTGTTSISPQEVHFEKV